MTESDYYMIVSNKTLLVTMDAMMRSMNECPGMTHRQWMQLAQAQTRAFSEIEKRRNKKTNEPEPFAPHPCETCQGTGVLRCTCAGAPQFAVHTTAGLERVHCRTRKFATLEEAQAEMENRRVNAAAGFFFRLEELPACICERRGEYPCPECAR